MDETAKKPRKPRSRELTIKQRKFVENYIATGFSAQSARDAGYKPTWAKVIAYNLLQQPLIKEAIAARVAQLEAKTEVTLQEIVDNARYLINLGKEKKNGADVAAGNKQLGEIIAAFKQVNQTESGLSVNIRPNVKIA